MFPNWTGWKTVKLVLAVATAACAGLPAPWGATVAQALGAVAAVVVILSGTSVGPAMAGKGKS